MKSSRKKYRRFNPSFASQVNLDGNNRVVVAQLNGFNKYGDAVGVTEEGEVIDVAFGIPGEEVEVEILGDRDGTLYGRAIKINTPAESRTMPECPHFGECGGCQLQHIDYGKQLQLKREIVIKTLRETGNIVDPPVSTMIKSPSTWGYRNNARFTVRNEGDIGFTNWITHRFEAIDNCSIVDPRINDIKSQIKNSLTSDDSQLSVRVGGNTESYMIQPNISNRNMPEELQTGQAYHIEKLLGFDFKVSSPSFFQVNTEQAETMVNIVRQKLAPTGVETLVDAYAGVGVFAGLLCPYYANVIAVEESASAVEDAQHNLVGLTNISLIQEKTENVMGNQNFIIDHLILDPPRSGCHKSVLDSILENPPAKIAYVSCDPMTLSRDLSHLVLGGFTIKEVIPIDMFPHTSHIESITILERPRRSSYVLASTSKRRVELLRLVDRSATILAPALDEDLFSSGLKKDLSPPNYSMEIALAKAYSLTGESKKPVIAADTVVVSPDGDIFGKPKNADEARKMLYALRGKTHEVITGLGLIDPGSQESYSSFATTSVRFRNCSDKEIEEYIMAEHPYDKAGAYGIQDMVLDPVEDYYGCPLNILGFPICEIQTLFGKMGLDPFKDLHKNPPRNLHKNCQEIFSIWMATL